MTVDGLARPVLVGGTGRSGSTIVGHLLDHHPDLTLSRPMEVRFIAGNDGFADALTAWTRKPGSSHARAASELAVDRLRHRWFERAPDVGLHTSMSREDVEEWSGRYLDAVATDPTAATRALVDAIMGRIADRLGAVRLVDTTPANARKADRLEPIYPDSPVIAVTRDGRDVAASFVSQSFGPDDVFAALAQWEGRMLRSHRAAAASRPGRVLTIELMDLVVTDRSATLAQVCEHVGISIDPGMVAWFDANVTADGMHPGRWRRDFDAGTCGRIDAEYAEVVERLAAEGVDIPR